MPDRMILQRRLDNSDGWRSVVRFSTLDAPQVQRAAAMLSAVDLVFWRVVRDDKPLQVLAVHDGRRWHAVGEAAA